MGDVISSGEDVREPMPRGNSEWYVESRAGRSGSAREFEAFWDELAREAGSARDCSAEKGDLSDALHRGDPGFDEACEALRKVMRNKPVQHEALYRILVLCYERRGVDEVERAVEAYPEFPLIMQPAYRLIRFLIEGGGLAKIELDTQGCPIDPKRKLGLSIDQADDLVASVVLETTEVGRAVADDLAPLKRMRRLFERFPDRVGLYADVLEFCCEPRTYAEVERTLTAERIDGIKTYNYEPGVAMKPSVFLDNLESAAAIVWSDHRWRITREGKLLLEGLRKKEKTRRSYGER